MEILFNITRWPLVMAVVLTLLWDGTHSLWMRTSQPETAGTIHIAGAHGRIEIRRNRDGVPQVSAGSERDAHFGLGYVHAQDRLLQMEFQRRLGNGRLSEILGESALVTDSLFRTVGLHRTAAAAWAKLNPEERKPIEAYVARRQRLSRQPPQPPAPARVQHPWCRAGAVATRGRAGVGQGGGLEHQQQLGQRTAACPSHTETRPGKDRPTDARVHGGRADDSAGGTTCDQRQTTCGVREHSAFSPHSRFINLERPAGSQPRNRGADGRSTL